jgi:hypothetical protein
LDLRARLLREQVEVDAAAVLTRLPDNLRHSPDSASNQPYPAKCSFAGILVPTPG